METSLRTDFESDAPIVSVVLALADPAGDADTWPLGPVQELRRQIRVRAHAAAVPYALSIQLRSASDLPHDAAVDEALENGLERELGRGSDT